MAKLTFNDNVGWETLKREFPNSKKILEDLYLILKIMGASPEIKKGKKRDRKRKKKKSSYEKYIFYADSKRQFTIYIYDYDKFQHKIRFYNEIPKGTIVYVENTEDIKSHLHDWLIDFK